MMINRRRWLAPVMMALALSAYVVVLQRNVHEKDRRTLQLSEKLSDADQVFISAIVTSVNPTARQLTVQLVFRIQGKIARDQITPAADLKLLVNNLSGAQEFDFPKGERMRRIEATLPLDGELNRYPMDRYETTLQLLVTTAGWTPKKETATAPGAPAIETHRGKLALGEANLRNQVPVAVSVAVLASVPGIKFTGDISRSGDPSITGIDLKLKRADNLIVVSVLVMCGMMVLALSVLAMALRTAAVPSNTDYLPLSLSISLIFGLPALRNIQPYVPPVGVLGDYFAFIWAELCVAASAIIIAWAWLARSEKV